MYSILSKLNEHQKVDIQGVKTGGLPLNKFIFIILTNYVLFRAVPAVTRQ